MKATGQLQEEKLYFRASFVIFTVCSNKKKNVFSNVWPEKSLANIFLLKLLCRLKTVVKPFYAI